MEAKAAALDNRITSVNSTLDSRITSVNSTLTGKINTAQSTANTAYSSANSALSKFGQYYTKSETYSKSEMDKKSLQGVSLYSNKYLGCEFSENYWYGDSSTQCIPLCIMVNGERWCSTSSWNRR